MVIMDTGVSYAILPANDFTAIIDRLGSVGVSCVEPKDSSNVSTHTCNCPNYSSLPDINIMISEDHTHKNTRPFTLPKESYME